MKSYEPKYHVIKGSEQIRDDLMPFQAQLENRLVPVAREQLEIYLFPNYKLKRDSKHQNEVL